MDRERAEDKLSRLIGLIGNRFTAEHQEEYERLCDELLAALTTEENKPEGEGAYMLTHKVKVLGGDWDGWVELYPTYVQRIQDVKGYWRRVEE